MSPDAAATACLGCSESINSGCKEFRDGNFNPDVAVAVVDGHIFPHLLEGLKLVSLWLGNFETENTYVN